MRKQSVKKLLFDKALLILTSIIILSGGVGLVFLLEDYAHISNGWLNFIFLCGVYILAATYGGLKYLKVLKRKSLGFVLLFCLQASVIIGMFLIFYFKVIELPQNGLLPWAIVLSWIAIFTVIFVPILTKKIQKLRNE